MQKIQMVDLKGQYEDIKTEVDRAIHQVIDNTQFIRGEAVKEFQRELAVYNGVKHVVGCANGTDALQIALMALELKPGDEVITTNFTFIATVEVIALLGLKPVLVDVYPDTFNIDIEAVEKAITDKTKAIIPVHLFGQSADMEGIMEIANRYNLFVVEDNAQGIGSDYTFSNGKVKKTGSIGHIGCTSFFPSKNLGCYGDGGALLTNDDELADKISVITNHGSRVKYYHDMIGVNSRLDTLQASVLRVKLPHLDNYIKARQHAASFYTHQLTDISDIETPVISLFTTHVYHQYTLKIKGGKRDELKEFLLKKGIPSMIYYPVPLHKQKAFEQFSSDEKYPVTDNLVNEVLSLPMHTELDKEQLEYITESIKDFFK